MTPGEKAARELRRIGDQVLGLPRGLRDIAQLAFGTPWHDLALARRAQDFAGALPVAPRIAVYLMLPQRGVQPSHLASLDYLAGAGCAPLVVSNLPLGAADRQALLARCWRLIERPNFGYDFGGYRHAVLSIAERLPGLEQLVLLNDSAWFPLPGAADWLAQVAALGTDAAGACGHFGDRWNPPASPRRAGRAARHFHLQSFALALGPRVLRDPGFLEFWRRYRMSNSKAWTCRLGETGLSQWLIGRGYSLGETLDVAGFARDLAALPRDELAVVLEEMPLGGRQARRRAALLADPAAGPAALAGFALGIAARQTVTYVMPAYAWRRHGFPFLKKALLRVGPEPAGAILSLCRALPGTPGAMVLAEAQALAGAASLTATPAGGHRSPDQP